MAKLKSSLLNMFLSLTIICVVAGGALAKINEITLDKIEASKKALLENAIKEVVPEFDNSPATEAYYGYISTNDSLKIYQAKKNSCLVGVAVESNSMKGFNGEIKIIVGFDAEYKIVNYVVLQHAETPGLGDKMAFWFKTDRNNQNILGRSLENGYLAVDKDGGDVDGITAATISSRAFLNAINRAYAVLSGKGDDVDSQSGATTSSDASSGASTSTDISTDTSSGATTSSDASSGATTQTK